MQHGKPDDHDDDPFPAGRGVTAGTRANARPLPSCHPGAAAASWLRPAQRLADSQPDAWILADTPAGCAQLASRLTGQPGWTPGRTFGFASVATPDLLALTPPGALAGMTGATAAGGSWRIGQGLLLVNDDPEGATP